VGTSAVYTPYLDKSMELSVAFSQGCSAEDCKQRLIGLNFEYGMGYSQFIGEWVFNQWQVLNFTEGHLSSSGDYVEGKYELGPGLPRCVLGESAIKKSTMARVAARPGITGSSGSKQVSATI